MKIEQILGLKKFESFLVEDCWRLRITDLQHLPDLLANNSPMEAVVIVMPRGRVNSVTYRVISNEPPRLLLKTKPFDEWFEQEITLIKKSANFGDRLYFTCPCGKKVNCLYFRPDVKKWACREELKLVYELTRIARESLLGELEYRLNRWQKLEGIESSMRSVIYDGQPTKRFMNLIRLRKKWLGPESLARIKQLETESVKI